MRAKRYPKFLVFANSQEILSAADFERAVSLGADSAMNLAEWALKSRPFALRRARELYISTCVRLYRASEEATR